MHLQCRAAANRCQIGIDPAFARFVKVENSRDGLLIRYTGKKRPEEPMTIELSSTGVPAQVKAIGRNSIWIDSVEAPKFVCKITDGGKLEVPGAKVEELVVKLTAPSVAGSSALLKSRCPAPATRSCAVRSASSRRGSPVRRKPRRFRSKRPKSMFPAHRS